LKDKEKEIKIRSACDKTIDAKVQERVDSISKILEGVKYKTESDRAEAIASFSQSSMTTEEIERVMAPGKPGYLAGQVYKKGVY
jgi:hypothetical protein